MFHWKSLNRQVRLRGPVEPVDAAEADAYFATRPRLAQIGAWASKQSAPLESRMAFEKAIALTMAKYAVGDRAAPAVLVGLPRHAAGHGVLARPAVPAARPDRIPARGGRASRGARRGSIRELVSRVMATSTRDNQPRRALLLTGASRGIGHATVKRFSAAGWRVITCSRHAFPENCPWEMGPEDHIQVDLADPASTVAAIDEIKQRLDNGQLHALVNNAAISPKADGGKRLTAIGTNARRLAARVPGEFLRADHAGARAARRAEGGARARW